jgi:hypothetical protein
MLSHDQIPQTLLNVFLSLFLLGIPYGIQAEERQSHGYHFENWVIDHFYNGKSNDYDHKWDASNKNADIKKVPTEFLNLPVSIKVVKEHQSIGFGDALRQFKIDQDFLLIVAIWREENSLKYWCGLIVKKMNLFDWNQLWEPIQEVDLIRYDSMVKDRTIPVEEIRNKAKSEKSMYPFSESIMQMNPKIDSNGQRRVQCSLRWQVYENWITQNTDTPNLWDVPIPNYLLQ